MAPIAIRKNIRRPLLTACTIAALLWASCGGIESAQQARDSAGYEELAAYTSLNNTSTRHQTAAKTDASVKAQSSTPLTSNPDYVGWLSVENTSVSYPLVQANDEKPDWYLKHDFWGSWSNIGCPHIDSRCNLGSRHVLAFGHHVGSTGLMFSPLAAAYQESVFSALGDAVITTPEGKSLRFQPLLALKVDRSYADIQTFAWEDADSFISWICDLEKESGAVLAKDGAAAEDIQQVLTLVTCSNSTAGKNERTLVVFAR